MASARPRSIIQQASPMASAELAQAVETVANGPCNDQRMAICPPAMFGHAWMFSLRHARGPDGRQALLGGGQDVDASHRRAVHAAGAIAVEVAVEVRPRRRHRLGGGRHREMGEAGRAGRHPFVHPAGRVEVGHRPRPGVLGAGFTLVGRRADTDLAGRARLPERLIGAADRRDDPDPGDGDGFHGRTLVDH